MDAIKTKIQHRLNEMSVGKMTSYTENEFFKKNPNAAIKDFYHERQIILLWILGRLASELEFGSQDQELKKLGEKIGNDIFKLNGRTMTKELSTEAEDIYDLILYQLIPRLSKYPQTL